MERNQSRIWQKQFFERLQGRPFWIWDREQHKREYDSSNGNCCFNHVIGLPMKKQIQMPLFDYENVICEALADGKHLWIKKATGLGITELMLRQMTWHCLKDSALKGSTMCIVTGPRIDLAINLIDRIKGLFPSIMFATKETMVTLNGVRIEAFPSHHLDAMRGLANVSFILLDEADFFPPGQQQDARDVSERYIGKSNPYIVMVSTPNAPGGLFESIEKEHEDECLYKRIFLPYTVGVGKIYFPEELRKARNSPSFDREYLGKYAGKIGNALHIKDINTAIELGKLYDPQGYVNPQTRKALGIDPGFGSSKFAFVVTERTNGRTQVLYAEEFERPHFTEMIDNAIELIRGYGIDKVYVDSANPEIIKELKFKMGERTDYLEQIATLKSQNISNISVWMKIIPVSFVSEQRELLGRLKLVLEKGELAINPVFEELILSLRTATEQDGVLIKADTLHNDLFDALRLALKHDGTADHPRIFAKSLGRRASPRESRSWDIRSWPNRVGAVHRKVYQIDPDTKVTTFEFDY